MVAAIYGALIAGAVSGLLPLLYGVHRERRVIGVTGLLVCGLCGLLGGLLVAVPVSIVFTVVIALLPGRKVGV